MAPTAITGPVARKATKAASRVTTARQRRLQTAAETRAKEEEELQRKAFEEEERKKAKEAALRTMNANSDSGRSSAGVSYAEMAATPPKTSLADRARAEEASSSRGGDGESNGVNLLTRLNKDNAAVDENGERDDMEEDEDGGESQDHDMEEDGDGGESPDPNQSNEEIRGMRMLAVMEMRQD